MSDLAAFLLARIEEDETVARAAVEGRWYFEQHDLQGWGDIYTDISTDESGVVFADNDREYATGCGWITDVAHVLAWQPARVLVECESKRSLIARAVMVIKSFDEPGGHWEDVNRRERYHARLTLDLLALPYADHPDFRDEWRTG